MDTFAKLREEREGVEWVRNGVSLRMSSRGRRLPCWQAAVGRCCRLPTSWGSRPRCCATGATAVRGGRRRRHRLCIPPRTRQRRFPGEISRLRRENDRLRMERDNLKKLWPSSRNRRDEVPPDRGSPGCLAGARHGRRARHLAVRLLCLAITAGKRAQDRQSRAAEQYPAGSRRSSGPVWGTAYPRRTAR